MADKIIKALALDGRVLITLADTKILAEEIKKIHDLTPTTTAIAGRIATIMTMMVHTSIKEEQNSITAQIKGNGPVGSIVTVGNLDKDIAKIKLYMQDTKVELPLKENGKIDVGGAVGNTGYLNIIKENSITKQNYTGMVPLVSGEIAEDFTKYFATSEQKPTVIALGVLVNKDGVDKSGGYMINLMPDATDEDIEKIEKALEKADSISKMLADGKSLEEIAKIVTGDEKLKIIEEDLKVEYECLCSIEKIKNGIILLGKEELEKIFSEQDNINVKCQFCNNEYDFVKEDFEEFLNS